MNYRQTLAQILFILLTATTFFAAANGPKPATSKIIRHPDQHLELEVEIADTLLLRQKGLMHRTSLGENQGMLFIYADQAPRSVWMKNTLIPLDVLFLNREGQIIDMLENLPPCKQDPCRIFESTQPARYMLEVNANFIKNHTLKPGDHWQLP